MKIKRQQQKHVKYSLKVWRKLFNLINADFLPKLMI